MCEDDKDEGVKGGSAIGGQNVVGEEGILLAGTSVYVLEPGEKPSKLFSRSSSNLKRLKFFSPYHL